MQQVTKDIQSFARIVAVGVGGAGGAAIDRMKEANVEGVEFISINTDSQALHFSKADVKLHIGKDTTRGLGAGADPQVGETAANESVEEIKEALKDADMVFVTIGAGGGTGSGAGHVVAQVAKDQGALVVGFATKPFSFEGKTRLNNAEEAISKLREHVDTLIIIPNDKLLLTVDKATPIMDAFKVADDVLRQGIQGISDLITVHGLINLDFADVKSIMKDAGTALMGIGRASGEHRAVDAATQAIESPLLEVSIDGARGVLFNIIGGDDMTMHDINLAAETITSAVDPSANIIFGATINPKLEGEMIVTVVATGFDGTYFGRTKIQNSYTEDTPSKIDISEAIQNSDLDDSEVVDDDIFENNTDSNKSAIWDNGDDEEIEEVSSLDKKISKIDEEIDPKSQSQDIDELDRPSFLRRFKINR
jgi:cell division protein FtsZ